VVEVIIVEGPDGGGKTTLVRRLHEDLGIALSEETKFTKAQRNDPSFRSPENVRLRVYRALLREVAGRKEPLLYDRLFFADLIYSDVYKRTGAFSYHEQVHIGRTMNACKTPVVFCVPPFEHIQKQNLSVDEEQGMEGLQQKIADVYNGYMSLGTLFMARKREFKELKGKSGGAMARTPRDYALPPVIWYDYTNGESYGLVKTAVMKYLSYRALRSINWT
jgi:hypothetical protein